MAGRKDDEPIQDDELENLFRGMVGQRLALAVSGGSDSLALMHLIARWTQTPEAQAGFSALRRRAKQVAAERPVFRPGPRPAGFRPPRWLGDDTSRRALVERDGWPPVVVFTVDHGLRAASAEEARAVAAEANAADLPHATLVWTGERPATGIQEKARLARYRLMAEEIEAEAWAFMTAGDPVFGAQALLERPHAARWLVTAHHREDQIETMLMRLARGSGVDGLAAMQATSETTLTAGGQRPLDVRVIVHRPLLAVPRSRLRATLQAIGRRAIEDPSNADTVFERVRVRQALPVLAGLGLTADSLALSIRRLDMARASLDQTARAGFAGVVKLHDGIVGEIDLAGLFRHAPDVRLRILRRVLASFAGQAEAPGLAAVEKLLQPLTMIWAEAGGGPVDWPAALGRQTLGGCMLEVEAKQLRIWREAGRQPLPRLELAPDTTVQWDRRFRITAPTDAGPGLSVAALNRSGVRLIAPFAGPVLKTYPREALCGMPAIWREEALVAVPFLDHATGGQQATLGEELAKAWAIAPWASSLPGPGRFLQQFMATSLDRTV